MPNAKAPNPRPPRITVRKGTKPSDVIPIPYTSRSRPARPSQIAIPDEFKALRPRSSKPTSATHEIPDSPQSPPDRTTLPRVFTAEKRSASDVETDHNQAKRQNREDLPETPCLRRQLAKLREAETAHLKEIYDLNQKIVGLKVQAAQESTAHSKQTAELNQQMSVLKKQAAEEKAIRLQASEQLAALQQKELHWNEWSRETLRMWCERFEARTKEMEEWKKTAEEESAKRVQVEKEAKKNGHRANMERWKRENFEEEARECEREVGQRTDEYLELEKERDSLEKEVDGRQRLADVEKAKSIALQAEYEKVVQERDRYRRMADDVSAQNYQWHMRYDNVVGWMAIRSMAFASEMAQLGNCGCLEVPPNPPVVNIDPILQNCVEQVGRRSMGSNADQVVPNRISG
jgi:hypothetical protein